MTPQQPSPPPPPPPPPSVTTVLGLLDKPGLSWAAAKETALFAVHHPDGWADLPAAAAVDRLRKHHRGIWDHRSGLGTCVHAVNEHWARRETVDLEALVDGLRQGSHVWQTMSVDAVVAELAVMVDGLERAWDALTPATVSVEDVVRYPSERQSYIGQSDWRATIDGHTYLLDIKTSGQTDPKKGRYPDSWRLQLAAYRGCREIVRYEGDGRVHRPYANGVKETGTIPLPPVERCAILHIRADGNWELIPVAAAGTEHNMFLRLVDVWYWLRREAHRTGAEPFQLAVRERECVG